MSEVTEVLKSRRSCRSFTDKRVPEDVLNTILEAGTYAPTGMGKQSPIIVAVEDKDTVAKLSKMNAAIMGADIDPFYGAQTVLVVLADKSIGTHVYDGALVMGNLMNAAEALGVQSCWIHRAKEEFESEEGKALLKAWGITGDYEGIGHCVLGYGEKVPAAPRKTDYIYRVRG